MYPKISRQCFNAPSAGNTRQHAHSQEVISCLCTDLLVCVPREIVWRVLVQCSSCFLGSMSYHFYDSNMVCKLQQNMKVKFYV